MLTLAFVARFYITMALIAIHVNDSVGCTSHDQSFEGTSVNQAANGVEAAEDRGLQRRPECGTRQPSDREVWESMAMVEEFYSVRDKGWDRRLQGPITVDVNFVIVSDTTGRGQLTDAQVDAHMAAVNANFAPHFNFRITSRKRVTNNNYFYLGEPPTNAEYDLKFEYGVRGATNLNIYSLLPVGRFNGWAWFPEPYEGVWDGVVVTYEDIGLPRGPVSAVTNDDHENKILTFDGTFNLTAVKPVERCP
jgi:hypothetical protein